MSRSLKLKIAGVLFALLAASHVNGQCLAGCAGGPTCDCSAAASHTHSTNCNCPGCDAFLDQSGAWPSVDESAEGRGKALVKALQSSACFTGVSSKVAVANSAGIALTASGDSQRATSLQFRSRCRSAAASSLA